MHKERYYLQRKVLKWILLPQENEIKTGFQHLTHKLINHWKLQWSTTKLSETTMQKGIKMRLYEKSKYSQVSWNLANPDIDHQIYERNWQHRRRGYRSIHGISHPTRKIEDQAKFKSVPHTIAKCEVWIQNWSNTVIENRELLHRDHQVLKFNADRRSTRERAIAWQCGSTDERRDLRELLFANEQRELADPATRVYFYTYN